MKHIKDTSEEDTSPEAEQRFDTVRWNPWLGAVYLVAVFFFAEKFVGPFFISLYPLAKHWDLVQANDWLQGSVLAQFAFTLIVEAFCIGAVLLFLKWYRVRLAVIGLRRPRWSDPLYGLAAAPVYYVLYFATVAIVYGFDRNFDIGQQQQIGFTNVHGAGQLVLTFVSLAILPPLAEEIMFRGMLYSSLKKALPKVAAVLIVSGLFASAHLPEGGAAGPLWIAAVDTFVLSLVLLYLREKTGGLWASMTLHAINNTVAFSVLFLLPLIH